MTQFFLQNFYQWNGKPSIPEKLRKSKIFDIKWAETKDVKKLLPNIDQTDKEELELFSGTQWQQVILETIDEDPSFLIYNKYKKPIGVFGFRFLKPGQTIMWLIGDPELRANPIELTKLSRKWIQHLSFETSTLFNVIDARHHKHIRWLKTLGFQFFPAQPYVCPKGISRKTYYFHLNFGD